MKTAAKLVTLTFAVLLGGTSLSAFADTAFERDHSRRDQVNDRLETQNHHIRNEVRAGKLSRHQAMHLHRADHHIRMEERRFARHHDGAITQAEQARLNRQENRVSRHISR